MVEPRIHAAGKLHAVLQLLDDAEGFEPLRAGELTKIQRKVVVALRHGGRVQGQGAADGNALVRERLARVVILRELAAPEARLAERPSRRDAVRVGLELLARGDELDVSCVGEPGRQRGHGDDRGLLGRWSGHRREIRGQQHGHEH